MSSDFVFPYSDQFIGRLKHIQKSRHGSTISSTHDVIESRGRAKMSFTTSQPLPSQSTSIIISVPLVSSAKTMSLSRGRSRSRSADASNYRGSDRNCGEDDSRSRSCSRSRSRSRSVGSMAHSLSQAPNALGFGSSSSTSRLPPPRADSPSLSSCSLGFNYTYSEATGRRSRSRSRSRGRSDSVEGRVGRARSSSMGAVSTRVVRKPLAPRSPMGFGTGTATHREPSLSAGGCERRGSRSGSRGCELKRGDWDWAPVLRSTSSSRNKKRSKSKKGEGRRERGRERGRSREKDKGGRRDWQQGVGSASVPPQPNSEQESATEHILHRADIDQHQWGYDQHGYDRNGNRGRDRDRDSSEGKEMHRSEHIHVNCMEPQQQQQPNASILPSSSDPDYFLDLSGILETAHSLRPPSPSDPLPSQDRDQGQDQDQDQDHREASLLHELQALDRNPLLLSRGKGGALGEAGWPSGLRGERKTGWGATSISPASLRNERDHEHNSGSNIVSGLEDGNGLASSIGAGPVLVLTCLHPLPLNESWEGESGRDWDWEGGQGLVVVRGASSLAAVVRALQRQFSPLPPDFDLHVTAPSKPPQVFQRVVRVLNARHSSALVPLPHLREDSTLSVMPCGGEVGGGEEEKEVWGARSLGDNDGENNSDRELDMGGDMDMMASIPDTASDLSEDTAQAPSFYDLYELGEVLGKGSYSTVHRAKEKHSGQTVAVKCVPQNPLSHEEQQQLYHEVDVLRSLNHPHVLRFFGFYMHEGEEGGEGKHMYQQQKMYFLVTELLAGGELFDRVLRRSSYSERHARALLFTLFSTIAHLHAHNIVHRDLKPENLLLSDSENDSSIKIADFGLAEVTDGYVSLQTPCGTPGYASPEVMGGKRYGKACDMWSVGVIMYVLLGGYPPFNADNYQESVLSPVVFHPEPWDHVSLEARDLIRRLLTVEPLQRYTAEEALQHPWMSQQLSDTAQLGATLAHLRHYHGQRKFKGVARAVMAARRMSLLLAPGGGKEKAKAKKKKGGDKPAHSYTQQQRQDRQQSSMQHPVKTTREVYPPPSGDSQWSDGLEKSVFAMMDDTSLPPPDLTLDDLCLHSPPDSGGEGEGNGSSRQPGRSTVSRDHSGSHRAAREGAERLSRSVRTHTSKHDSPQPSQKSPRPSFSAPPQAPQSRGRLY